MHRFALALSCTALAAPASFGQGLFVETFDGSADPAPLAASGWSFVVGTNNPITVGASFAASDAENVLKITAVNDAGSQFTSAHVFVENDYLPSEPNNFGRGDALLWTSEPITGAGATAIDVNGAHLSVDYSNGSAINSGPSLQFAFRLANGTWWLYETPLLGNNTQQVQRALMSTDPIDDTFTFVPLIFEPWNNYNVDVRLIPNDTYARELTTQELSAVTAVGLYTFPAADASPVRIDNFSIWGFRTVGSGIPAAYCTGKLNSDGCVPQVTCSGVPSATSGLPFVIGTFDALEGVAGVLFYGFGTASAPFQGGTRCVASPTRRTPVQTSGASPAPTDCPGLFLFDFNAYTASGADAMLVTGTQVFAQWWYRDAGVNSTTGLSNALQFTLN